MVVDIEAPLPDSERGLSRFGLGESAEAIRPGKGDSARGDGKPVPLNRKLGLARPEEGASFNTGLNTV